MAVLIILHITRQTVIIQSELLIRGRAEFGHAVLHTLGLSGIDTTQRAPSAHPKAKIKQGFLR